MGGDPINHVCYDMIHEDIIHHVQLAFTLSAFYLLPPVPKVGKRNRENVDVHLKLRHVPTTIHRDMMSSTHLLLFPSLCLPWLQMSKDKLVRTTFSNKLDRLAEETHPN